jgi:hypothetical protein
MATIAVVDVLIIVRGDSTSFQSGDRGAAQLHVSFQHQRG